MKRILRVPPWLWRVERVAIIIAAALVAATAAQAAEKKVKAPIEACQTASMGAIARDWPNVFQGAFEVEVRGGRCLLWLKAPSAMAEGKFALWLINVGNGNNKSQLMGEFYGPNNGKRGLCSYAGVRARECDLEELVTQANQL